MKGRRIIPDGAGGDALVRRLERRLRAPGRSVGADTVLRRAARARVVLVGDYRPSAAPKRWLGELLAVIAAGVPLMTDAFYRIDAEMLALWRAGRLPARDLRRAGRFDLEIGAPFGPYAALFRDACRGRPVRPIESPVRSDRPSRARRFGLAARRAGAELASGRGVFLVGQAYLARGFLPAMLRRELGLSERDLVTILFQRGVSTPRALGEGCFVLPLQRPGVARSGGLGLGRVDLAATVWGLLDELCRRLGVDPYRRSVHGPEGAVAALRDLYPNVLSEADGRLVGPLLTARGLSRAAVARARAAIAAGQSRYLPGANVVIIGRARMVDAAEEVSHFLNFALRGDVRRSLEPASFHQEAWDEAIGYLGSKLLHPTRPALGAGDVARLGRRGASGVLARFLAEHLRMEADAGGLTEVPAAVTRVLRDGGRLRERGCHLLGYHLGARMYAAHRAGSLPAARARRLFEARSLPPGPALRRYLRVSKELRT